MSVDCDYTLSLGEWLNSEEAGDLQKLLEERISKFLFSGDLTDFQFQKIIEQLAWIGTAPDDRVLLGRTIVELNDFAVEPCGFFSEVWKTSCKIGNFIAEHKTEILVGVALCATGIGIAAAAGYTVSVAAGGVVVAGAGSLFASDNKPNPHIPQIPPMSSKADLAFLQGSSLTSLPNLELPSSEEELLITHEGIWAGGQFFSNNKLMQSSLFAGEFEERKKGSVQDNQRLFLNPVVVKSNRQEFLGPDQDGIHDKLMGDQILRSTFLNNSPLDDPRGVISRKFILQGEAKGAVHIGWINGINNSLEESMRSGAYLQKLTGGHTISGIYNATHSVVTDVLEAGLLNYNGYSPITAKMLHAEWSAFHEANVNRPNARFLQVCHSQGAIHVRNALESSPKEIRDRVIVVAIAPAAVVPKYLCFKAFNYASEKDFIYKLEPDSPRSIESLTLDDVLIPSFGDPMNHKDELVILKPHPEAKGIDHEFQSPTYLFILEKLLMEYNERGGEYDYEEKGSFK